MNITIIQGAFFPVPAIQGGAVEKIWYRMGIEFAVLGHNVTHISRSHPRLKNFEKAFGVKYVRIGGYDTPASLIKLKLLDLFYSWRAVKKIPQEVDVIVTNTFWSPILIRGKSAKKVYVSVERFPRGQMKLYKHVGILRGCSPSICDAIKKELSKSLHHIISYVPNPVPFDIKSINLPRQKTILFVGRLHPEKGLHILLEAFKILDKEFKKEWNLIVIGPYDVKDGGGGDEYFKELEKISKNLNVLFVDPIYNDDKLASYYASSSIFCYPAQEGSGDAAPVAPREAMAYGCVPVVSMLECFNDFISAGLNGLTFNQKENNQSKNLSDTLQFLMKNEEKLKEMSEKAKQVTFKYAAKSVAKVFIDDFNKLATI